MWRDIVAAAQDPVSLTLVETVLGTLLTMALGALAAAWRASKRIAVDREKIVSDAVHGAQQVTFEELKAVNASLTEQRDFFKAQWIDARTELNELRERIRINEEQIEDLRGQLDRRHRDSPPRAGGRRHHDPDD